jgi:hypothetical protein
MKIGVVDRRSYGQDRGQVRLKFGDRCCPASFEGWDEPSMKYGQECSTSWCRLERPCLVLMFVVEGRCWNVVEVEEVVVSAVGEV